MVPVKSCDWGMRQDGVQQLHWCWCLELGFSVQASSDLKLCLVVGINWTFQILAWYRVEWFCWGYTALCLLRTWALVFFKKQKASCYVKVVEGFSRNSNRCLPPCFWPFNFHAPKYVLLSMFFFPYRNVVWYYGTISGCSSVHNLPLWFLALASVLLSPFPCSILCAAVLLFYCSLNVSCVNERSCCPKRYSGGVGKGGVVNFLLLSALHLHFFNSDQYNIC